LVNACGFAPLWPAAITRARILVLSPALQATVGGP
jgi:hypothetical protein